MSWRLIWHDRDWVETLCLFLSFCFPIFCNLNVNLMCIYVHLCRVVFMFPMWSTFWNMDSIFTYLVFMESHHRHFTPSMYQYHMGHWDHFWSHWFQFLGQQAALEIYSPLEKIIVIRVVQKQAWWFLFEIFLRY